MKTELYLQKLNLQKKSPSLNFLNELISAHQKFISFNNLAVYYNREQIIDLELAPLFEKVVTKGEGGYCFENNKVFYYLLKDLSFEIEPKLARVIYDHTGDRPRTHRMSIVTLDGRKYLADVGFGRDVPPHAVPIGVEQKIGHHVIKQGEIYYHQLLKGEATINLYTFDDGHYQESDFMVGNYYTNTHPDSRFRKEVIVVRKESGLTEFINNRTYTRIHNGVREDVEIENQVEFDRYLKTFGLSQSFDYEKLPSVKIPN